MDSEQALLRRIARRAGLDAGGDSGDVDPQVRIATHATLQALGSQLAPPWFPLAEVVPAELIGDLESGNQIGVAEPPASLFRRIARGTGASIQHGAELAVSVSTELSRRLSAEQRATLRRRLPATWASLIVDPAPEQPIESRPSPPGGPAVLAQNPLRLSTVQPRSSEPIVSAAEPSAHRRSIASDDDPRRDRKLASGRPPRESSRGRKARSGDDPSADG